MRNRKLKAPPQKQKKEKKAPKRDQDNSKKRAKHTQAGTALAHREQDGALLG